MEAKYVNITFSISSYFAITFSKLEMFLTEETGSITRRMQTALMKVGFTSTEGGLV